MKLTRSEKHRALLYSRASPIQLGSLWQRMQYVMKLMHESKDSVPDELWHAIHDLETEVSYHESAKPPYGRRAV